MTIKKIGFIGAGNIAEALIRGFISSSKHDPGEIIIFDTRNERLEEINRHLGAFVAKDIRELVELSDLIIISVKPNLVETVLKDIKKTLAKEKIVISLAAGKSLDFIQDLIDQHELTLRIMPNLAAKVRKSTISLFAKQSFPRNILEDVIFTLGHVGKVFKIDDEHLMPSITALAGSAPAYYVMMADALIEFGVSEGMDRELAKRMILQTMEGSAVWAESSNISLDKLWKQVVTPGGTTAAGIDHFQKNKFLETFVEGLRLATKRAKEMGDLS